MYCQAAILGKKDQFVLTTRFSPLRFMQAMAPALTVLVLAAPDPAFAQAKLDARYAASLGGLPVGRGAWVIDVHDDQFTAAASGMASGLFKLFAGGVGSSASRGSVVNGQLVPKSYAATITISKKKDEVEMALENGAVKEFSAKPPSTPDPDRVPVTEAHRRNVTDPMTASLMRVVGTADPVTKEACQRSVAIFDGRLRYDLKLAFKRMEKVRAEKGYQGPAVVCSVSFTPVAGYIPNRPVVKYLTEAQDMEIWLAPIAGTRIVVPFRIAVPTPLGDAVVEATQFQVSPRAPTSAKAL